MVEGGKKTGNKVITANKIIFSLLPGFSTLLPQKISSISTKDVPTKSSLLENPQDDKIWYCHLKATKNTAVLEEACNLYPKFWKTYERNALYYILNKKTQKAYNIYGEALKIIDDYDLYSSYLKFLYHTGSIHEYIEALINAVDKVGIDHRSDMLWRELVMIMVKIYNCNLLSQNIQNGLLPDLFPLEGTIGNDPLIPTEAEQIVYKGTNTLAKGNQTYNQLYGEVNYIRKLFQRWLRTPTNNMRALWDAYSHFENTVSASTILATKILGEQKNVHNLSSRAYERLHDMYSKVYPVKPAALGGSKNEDSAEQRENLNHWLDIIKYEESNPMELSLELAAERVLFTFSMALIPLANSNRMWYLYFQFLLLNNQRDKAISELKGALDSYLKNDDKMSLILGIYLGESGDSAEAFMVLRNRIASNLNLLYHEKAGKKDLQLRELLVCGNNLPAEDVQPSGAIHYLNCIRLEKGKKDWREELQVILIRKEFQSWELFWYAANTELRCFKDTERAIALLVQAQEKLPFDIHYTLLYVDLLLNLGKIMEARILLSELANGATVGGNADHKFSVPDRIALWNFFMNMEYFYGTKEQFEVVKSLYLSAKLSAEVGLDVFTEKSRKSYPCTITQIFSDISNVFIRKNMDSSKREASINMNSALELRQRLFCAGIDFDELDNVFGFRGKSLLNKVSADASSGSSVQAPAVGPSSLIKTPPAVIGKRDIKISRPDVTRLSPLSPTSSDSLESLIFLHGSRRPALPLECRALDSIATPPKVLFDLLRVLPCKRLRQEDSLSLLYVNAESVDYLIRTLDCMDISNIDLEQYNPIPINQLLLVKSAMNRTADGMNLNSDLLGQENDLYSIIKFIEENTNEEKKTHKDNKKKQKIAI